LKKQKEYHITYEKEISAKLENARTQVHDLEKKHEDILIKVTDYENRLCSLCTEVQESQKEVDRLTDDLSQKVRLSLEQCHKLKYC
jgi:chromosome segregation ATPase